MYTTCPDCNSSFRVTAKVLQQAKGNVRCGSCEHVFNALEYLSEEMPEPARDTASPDRHAETSRRLLETLDQLAGPEKVRIEDTGIEWRVLDEDDPDTNDADRFATEEMRYDDSTMLSDDFGQELESLRSRGEPARRESDFAITESAEFDELQGDLALSEPEEWTDLLEEVSDPDSTLESETLEAEEELATIHDQLPAREESNAGQPTPVGPEYQFDAPDEAIVFDLPASELALTDEVPLLKEEDVERFVMSDEEQADDEDDSDGVLIAGEDAIEIVDESLEFDKDDDEADVFEVEDEEYASSDDDYSVVEELDGVDDDDERESEDEADRDRESTGEFEANIEKAARWLAGEDDLKEPVANEDGDGVLRNSDTGEIEHIVPPLTEDEMTVNMEIDQEMMALATQDDNFSATLVGLKSAEQLFSEHADDVETIIMEGEFVRSEIDLERLAAENASRGQLGDSGSLVDTYALRRGKVRGGRRRHDPVSYGITAAIVVLALTLVGQIVHNSRESLATMGMFNQTVAPVYRMLGSPVTPSWDVRGWQFEVTNGNVDENEQALTIVSRIVNRADQPLPYPLIHISLTDRWEDIMGSKILEPGEYLAGDLDPSSPVLPGENFTAVITIEDPSAEATGFKLNVCYRVAPGSVRCAIEDFKD
ncbi:MAG: zinc-ribbon and DUF3426 domain-containing protein [Proteobacteria bacterium]|nr:zinc-ribbon and DUF3426 domain-containing protein [Pseudomonadota bacterium]MDA0992701.1 zinc-ribbon and DUF3426 domain-containing protein [Pseudomonadota bacterium]